MSLYWLFVLGNLSDISVDAMALSILCSLISAIAFLVCKAEGFEEIQGHSKTMLKVTVSSSVIFFLFTLFVPSEKQLIGIFAADYVSDIEGINELPENVIKALNAQLKKVSEDD